MRNQKIRETRQKTRRRGVTFSHKVNEATEAYGMDEPDRVVIQALIRGGKAHGR